MEENKYKLFIPQGVTSRKEVMFGVETSSLPIVVAVVGILAGLGAVVSLFLGNQLLTWLGLIFGTALGIGAVKKLQSGMSAYDWVKCAIEYGKSQQNYRYKYRQYVYGKRGELIGGGYLPAHIKDFDCSKSEKSEQNQMPKIHDQSNPTANPITQSRAAALLGGKKP